MGNFKQQFLPLWKTPWLRRSIISAVTFIIILTAIPFILQFSLTHLLIKQGASEASIEDINLNVFSGTLELKQLSITTGDYHPSKLDFLHTNINMLDLLSSKIVLQNTQIDGLDIDLQLLKDGNYALNGLPLPASQPATDSTLSSENETSTPIHFGVAKLSIINSKINYQEPGFSHKNRISSLHLSNLKSWDKASSAKLKVDAILNTAAFKLDADLTLFDAIPQFKGKASLGSLAFYHYQKFHAAYIDILDGGIQLDTGFDILLSDIITAKLDYDIQLKNVDINYQGIKPKFKKLSFQGKTELTNIDLANFLQQSQEDQGEKLLSLFTGTLELDQLLVSAGNHKPAEIKQLKIDVGNLDPLSNRFILDELSIDGLNTDIQRADNGQISVNGIVIPGTGTEADSESKDASTDQQTARPVAVEIHKISLTNSDINYQETGFQQLNHINTATLTNIKTWDKSSTAKLSLDSTINQAAFKLTAGLNIFSDEKQFKGSTSLSDLSFTPYAKFYDEYLDKLQGSISLESKFEVKLADSISAKLANHVEINDLDMDYREISQSVQQISWTGNSELSEKGEHRVKGDLTIKNNLTTDRKLNYLISSFEILTINGLETHQGATLLEKLQVKNMQLISSQKDKQLVSVDAISYEDIAFQASSSDLKIKQIEIDNPQISVSIKNQGEQKQKIIPQLALLLQTLERINPPSPEQAEQAEQDKKSIAQQAAKPLNLEIASLKLVKPGSLYFFDSSVTPGFITTIHLNRLGIDNISSQNNAHFDIALKQGDYATIDIIGDGLVLDPTKYVELTAKIKQLDLPPVTPYSNDVMGYGMRSGVVDSTIQVKIENREIDSEVNLKLDSIEVVETSKDTAEQLSSASGMSIDLALSALKDNDNIINLKLPVKGNLDKPDFDLKHIINMAMGKAMASATISYLKYALQPFGSLVTIFSMAKKAANHITLPPVLFEPNTLTIKKGQQELLDKVISVLKQRPGLKIKACGVSAEDDQVLIKSSLLKAETERLAALMKEKEKQQKAANKATDSKQQPGETETIAIDKIEIDPKLIHQKMHDLADNRSAKIKAVFLQQGGLESSRILNCLSTTKLEEKSKPSVELML